MKGILQGWIILEQVEKGQNTAATMVKRYSEAPRMAAQPKHATRSARKLNMEEVWRACVTMQSTAARCDAMTCI